MQKADREKQVAEAEELLGDRLRGVGFVKGFYFGQFLGHKLLPFPDPQANRQTNEMVDKLRAFWEGVTAIPHLDWAAQLLDSFGQGDTTRQILNQTSALSALIAGAPGFFGLRFPPPLFRPAGSIHATSFYDTGGLATTLERLIDFERINS